MFEPNTQSNTNQYFPPVRLKIPQFYGVPLAFFSFSIAIFLLLGKKS